MIVKCYSFFLLQFFLNLILHVIRHRMLSIALKSYMYVLSDFIYLFRIVIEHLFFLMLDCLFYMFVSYDCKNVTFFFFFYNSF